MWDSCLKAVGLHLEHSKCHSWIPQAEFVNPVIDCIVKQDLRGLVVLGSAAEGDLESHLGPFALHTDPVHKRIAAAQQLSEALCHMATTVLECASKQAIWILLSRLLSHKLDFDARVLSQSLFGPFAEQLASFISLVVSRVLPDAPLEALLPQLVLPGHLGGCYLSDPFDIAICAPLASFLQVRPLVARSLRALQLDHVIPFLPSAAASESLDTLLELSAVMVDVLGVPINLDPLWDFHT